MPEVRLYHFSMHEAVMRCSPRLEVLGQIIGRHRVCIGAERVERRRAERTRKPLGRHCKERKPKCVRQAAGAVPLASAASATR